MNIYIKELGSFCGLKHHCPAISLFILKVEAGEHEMRHPSKTNHNISCWPPLELPKSLQLPALKTLRLSRVLFTATDNVCAEPFTTCNLLNTLVLNDCFLHNDAKILFISNSNLSSLKLMDLKIRDTFQHKVVLSTPNLSSLTVCIFGASSLSIQPLSSTCNLSCLEEGTIDIATDISHPVLIGWLQVFTNVKILTLSYETLKLILKVSHFYLFYALFIFIRLVRCLHYYVKVFSLYSFLHLAFH